MPPTTMPPTAPTAAAKAKSPANLKLMGASSSRKCGSFLWPSGGLRVGGDAWDRRECFCLCWWGRGMLSAGVTQANFSVFDF